MRLELDKKGIDLDSILCPSCNDEVESVVHCLMSCNMAAKVWDEMCKWWGIERSNVIDVNEILRGVANKS